MKWRLPIIIAVLVLSAVAGVAVPASVAIADSGPSDEMLVAAACPRVGIAGGLMLLDFYSAEYAEAHPGLDWNQAYPHILNGFVGFWGCGHVILNPGDANQIAAPIVRILGPSLRLLYNNQVGTFKK